jgi:hypothetical protein
VAALPNVDDFFWEKDPTPILDTIDAPIHLKNLSSKELKQLADEVRSEISFIMSTKCQPCGPGRSVVELTIAIHYVFNAPMDKILWDAGQHVRHPCVNVSNYQISFLLKFLIFYLLLFAQYFPFSTGVCTQDSHRKALSLSYY